MTHQVNDEWIINNQNLFGLNDNINLSISCIQYEISSQIKNKAINSIADYLGSDIEITKEIQLTESLSIKKIFEEFLGFENIDLLEQKTVKCYLVLSYLQLSLLKEYTENKHNNILTFSEYDEQYSTLLNSFLSSNIDTDEKDFIKQQQTICNNLINELNKPIYNVISPFNEVLDEPCHFKKNLINSIDKRKKFLEKKMNESTPKIKALFQFIEYLHSNIENFNKYNYLIKELEVIKEEKNKLKPKDNYKDKLRYDILQAELESKFKILKDNTSNLIKDKAKELNVCDFDNDDNFTFKGIEAEIQQLKLNFNNEDLSLIFHHKNQYLNYRSQTHKTFLSLTFFFDKLDEITKILFDYFKDTEQNEYEPFETKSVNANDIFEAIKMLNQGHKRIIIPSSFLDRSIVPQTNPINQFQRQELQNRNKIAHELIGDNKSSNTSVVYHHIKDIINKYGITEIEARQILLDMKGSFSSEQNDFIVEPIISYLERSNFKLINDEEPQPQNTKSKEKPNFATSIVDEVYEILKEHFDTDEHTSLKNLLKNNIEPNNKLYFKNKGNKLTDAFKKLIEANLITKCIKAELEKWVCDNFQFKHRNTRQDFKLRTVQDVISNKNSKQPCKNPLFNIDKGNITKL